MLNFSEYIILIFFFLECCIDQLESLLALVVSWQKMEFQSWPVLLDEVQHQYDINAGKVS